MAAIEDVTIFRGEDIDLPVTMVPTPTDISGWTIQFSVRQNIWDTTTVFTKTTADGSVELTDPPGGIFTVHLSHADTLLVPGCYRFDAAKIDAGEQDVLATGYLFVLPECTS